jgi:hypothetical protein
MEALDVCPCYSRVKNLESPNGEETPAERGVRLHKVMETGNMELCRDEIELDGCTNGMMFVTGAEAAIGPNPEIHTEIKLSVGNLTWGTADRVSVWPSLHKAFLADYKFIRHENVSPPGSNLQLECYVAGVFEMFPDVNEVVAALIAPLINWAPPTHTYTRAEDYDKIVAHIKRVVEHANDPFKKPLTGDMCSTCANAARCPALGVAVMAVAHGTGLPMPEAFAPDAIVSSVDRAKAQLLARALANWSEMVLKNNNDYIRGNPDTEIPGHSKVVRKGNLSITNTAEALVALRAILSVDQILATVKLSLPQLTEAIALGSGKTKADAREFLESQLEGCIDRGPDIVYLQRKKSVADRELLGM